MKRPEQILQFEERVDLFLNDKLSQDQIDELWIESIEDSSRYDYLKTVAALRNEFFQKSSSQDQLPAEKPNNKPDSAGFVPTSRLANIAVAAGLTLAVGVSSVYLYNTSESQTLVPLSTLEFSTLRSGVDVKTEKFQKYIQDAINKSITGDADIAVLELYSVFEQSTDSDIRADALMNIGIIKYNSSDFRSAGINFKQIINQYNNDIFVVERATWYLAQAQIALGDLDAAKVSINRVIEIDGAHSRAAENYLRYLR
ncbi:MAG: hypothetical protein LAT57_11360 [Balneolales bacterium]|nr:hypothetical protein [Balneolales bacterium]